MDFRQTHYNGIEVIRRQERDTLNLGLVPLRKPGKASHRTYKKRSSRPKGEEGRTAGGRGGSPEKVDENAASTNVLVPDDPHRSPGTQSPQDPLRGIPALDDRHPETFPVSGDVLIEERVSLPLGDGIQGDAPCGNAGATHLPVAHVAGYDDQAFPFLQGLIQGLEADERHPFPNPGSVLSTHAKSGNRLPPEVPEGRFGRAPVPIGRSVGKGAPKVTQHRAPPYPEHHAGHPSDGLAQPKGWALRHPPQEADEGPIGEEFEPMANGGFSPGSTRLGCRGTGRDGLTRHGP